MNNTASVATAVDELALGETFTFDELVMAVQRNRGRQLRIVELAELGVHDGLCAVWLGAEDQDLILHAHSDSALHRQQFVLHELAHMILGHKFDEYAEAADFLLPDIPKETRRRLLRRQNLDSAEEVQAETLADIFAAAIRRSMRNSSRFAEIFG
ncbi:ImmA/IrrE family metallo-endopeptidase [Cryobacterium sp. PH31-L1]|uniref:ImmA/IrrE family metallo-endopeptidase n=1 Tax=Cryobacterium sp. PH31-L1 TaxID=3046199 RepID=UPI0024BB2FA5|nr:ImmA/IrrE family metallo-endopeptidase [Cryobacterium sp. PH31-L1]MDJ0378485.1 ImmA/IrrE family metallo-endopeptidase [Cryobacterium sp. PH31-L1]